MTDTCRIERTLAAPIDRVWAAWTDPTLLARWYCPNPDLETTVTADLRPGGRYVVDMGGQYVARGSYETITEPTLLVFSWSWDHEPEAAPSTVTVALDEVPGGTRLVLTHAGLADAEDATGHREGWELSLGRLDGVVAGD